MWPCDLDWQQAVVSQFSDTFRDAKGLHGAHCSEPQHLGEGVTLFCKTPETAMARTSAPLTLHPTPQKNRAGVCLQV